MPVGQIDAGLVVPTASLFQNARCYEDLGDVLSKSDAVLLLDVYAAGEKVIEVRIVVACVAAFANAAHRNYFYSIDGRYSNVLARVLLTVMFYWFKAQVLRLCCKTGNMRF